MIFNDFWLVTKGYIQAIKTARSTSCFIGSKYTWLSILVFSNNCYMIHAGINVYIITHARNVSAHEIHPDPLCMRYAVKHKGKRETES